MKKSYYFFIALTGLVVDQLIKNFVISVPQFNEQVFINKNFAWNLPVENHAIVVIMIFVIIGLIFLMTQKSLPIIWIIVAGALSNLIDRVLFGGVIDYIHTPLGGIINLADIMISLGVVLIILDSRKIKI
ncbi:signal peptidase II [Patescibacteria group bacterium]|nr:signal peptidase II [Patescibacteria group bacterium]